MSAGMKSEIESYRESDTSRWSSVGRAAKRRFGQERGASSFLRRYRRAIPIYIPSVRSSWPGHPTTPHPSQRSPRQCRPAIAARRAISPAMCPAKTTRSPATHTRPCLPLVHPSSPRPASPTKQPRPQKTARILTVTYLHPLHPHPLSLLEAPLQPPPCAGPHATTVVAPSSQSVRSLQMTGQTSRPGHQPAYTRPPARKDPLRRRTPSRFRLILETQTHCHSPSRGREASNPFAWFPAPQRQLLPVRHGSTS